MLLIKKIQFAIFVVLVTFPFFMLGCSGTGGSSSTEPLADEPMIIDSAMCVNVSENRPDGITNTFLSTDNKICVWIYWSNLADTSTAKAVWYQPGKDTSYREDSQMISTNSGFGITFFYIDKPLDGFKTGEWSVDLFLDGKFERSHLFSVNE